MRTRLTILALLLIGAAPPPERCDPQCLTGLATAFVDALATRGASAGLPWAERVRYAENGVPMMVDDGIWASVTARGSAPLVIADPTTHMVLWMGEAEEHGQPSFLALRLKAEGRRIAEAEEVIRRQQGRPPFADPKSFAFDAGLTATLPAAARSPRARMEAAVRAYYASLSGKPAPRFAADCARTENGVATTSGDYGPAKIATGCGEQIRLGLFRDIESVRGLSFPVADEARGLIVVMGTRDYDARTISLRVSDGRAYVADAPFPHSYAFVAVFKLTGGAIGRIQEVSSPVPYQMLTWAPQP